MEQPKNTTDAIAAGAGTAALIPEGTFAPFASQIAQEAT
jgi:hypothetical protein